MTGRPPIAHVVRQFEHKLPFWRLLGAVADEPYAFLLDSAAPVSSLSRYSYLGANPFRSFSAKRIPGRAWQVGLARIEITDQHGDIVTALDGDPFAELRALLGEYRVEPGDYTARPTPFLSGAVGYFGFEASYFLERLPDSGTDELELPDLCFGLHDVVVVHDHETSQTFVSSVGRGPDARAAQSAAEQQADRILDRLAKFEEDCESPSPVTARRDTPELSPLLAHQDELSYTGKVDRVLEHICAGDAFEVCLTRQVRTPYLGSPLTLYQELRRVNPAPFAAYLRGPGFAVASASPERFLKLDTDGLAESRPIKGTRPRGADPAEDLKLRADLASSPKDRAENTMIVDLVRNDLGRVCEAGSVTVTQLHRIEQHPTVFQLVSAIQGRLGARHDAIDLVRACFPAGSMTGAPKVESLKIIDSLEPVKRGIYSGALGFLDFNGSFDLNVVIRTIVLSAGEASFGVGGAVVADSKPAEEYEETLHKGDALVRALSAATAAEREGAHGV